jgi:hypothetical protein
MSLWHKAGITILLSDLLLSKADMIPRELLYLLEADAHLVVLIYRRRSAPGLKRRFIADFLNCPFWGS